MKDGKITFLIVALNVLVSTTTFGQENRSYKEFYPNGKLKAIKHQGQFGGCGVNIGTDSIYYESGQLASTIYYDNHKSKTQGGCHENWTVKKIITFYKSGKIKTRSKTKLSYEGADCKCGTWFWYTEKGVLYKKQQFKNCYDEKFDCD
jgi:antitoxin component YwqK of YwqJK toxin-antitoxin module